MNSENLEKKIHLPLSEIHNQALSWVNQQLTQRQLVPVSKLISVHDSPWSVVAKVAHEKGTWYFKALAEHIAYELEATLAVDDTQRFHQQAVIATCSDQGYLLLDDLGPVLVEHQPEGERFALWQQTLAQYSQLQLQTAKAGRQAYHFLPNRTLEKLPELALPIIERCLTILPQDGERAIEQADVDWCRQFFSKWEQTLAKINQCGLPNAIHHGDLHGANMAVNHGHVTVFDWGDSSWSHPFVSYYISEDACTHQLGEQSTEALAAMRKVYLEPWQSFAPMADLEATLAQVNKISPLIMLLSWAHASSNANDERNAYWQSRLVMWVNVFLKLNRENTLEQRFTS